MFKSDELRKDKIKFKKRLQKYEESKKNEENKSDLKKNLIKGGTKNINLLIKLIKNQKKLKNKNVEKENQIEINIPLFGARIKEIIFILNEKEKNDKDKINELYDIISNLKQENKQLKENQKKLEENQKKLEENQKIIH